MHFPYLYLKNLSRNILVSAAAGSGKTAVLVERIVKIITDKNHPVDIDHLLIVTFTNAAAAEMRERIGNAIEKALDEQPGNEHLLRHIQGQGAKGVGNADTAEGRKNLRYA